MALPLNARNSMFLQSDASPILTTQGTTGILVKDLRFDGRGRATDMAFFARNANQIELSNFTRDGFEGAIAIQQYTTRFSRNIPCSTKVCAYAARSARANSIRDYCV